MTIRELMSGGLITVGRETPVLEARDRRGSATCW